MMTDLEQAVLDVLKLDGVDYVTIDRLARLSNCCEPEEAKVFVETLWEINKRPYVTWKMGKGRILRALQSLVKKGLVDHPARGKYAAKPVRKVKDFMATLKPWDCVKVRGEWMLMLERHKLRSQKMELYAGTRKGLWAGGAWQSIALHEIDTQDIRNVKPGGE